MSHTPCTWFVKRARRTLKTPVWTLLSDKQSKSCCRTVFVRDVDVCYSVPTSINVLCRINRFYWMRVWNVTKELHYLHKHCPWYNTSKYFDYTLPKEITCQMCCMGRWCIRIRVLDRSQKSRSRGSEQMWCKDEFYFVSALLDSAQRAKKGIPCTRLGHTSDIIIYLPIVIWFIYFSFSPRVGVILNKERKSSMWL